MTSAELDAVRADDLLLDALGAGLDRLDAAGDPASAALARWRQELGAAADAVGIAEPDFPAVAAGMVPLPQRRPARGVRRGLAALAATAAVLAGGGVAAAAVSGPHGPLAGLHRLIFGGMHQLPAHAGSGDTVVVQTERLLDHAAQLLRSAPRPVPAPDRDAIAGMLNRAAALLSSDFRLDATRAAQFAARLDRLRTLLATLSASSPRATSGPSRPPSAGAVRPAPAESAPALSNGAGRGEGRPGVGGATSGDGSRGEDRSTAPRRSVPKPADSIAPVESSAASSAGDNGSGASEDNGSGATTSGGNADGNQTDAPQPDAHPSGSGGQGGAGDQGGSGGGSNGGDSGGGSTGGTGDQ